MNESDAETLSPRPVTVAAVNWTAVLDFTQLFRGFRLSINPAKIVLALLAILLIYCAGRVFDYAWGPQVYRNEIDFYQTMKPSDFRQKRSEVSDATKSMLQRDLEQSFGEDTSPTDPRVAALVGNPRQAYRALRSHYEAEFARELAAAHEKRLNAEKEHRDNPSETLAKSPAEIEQEDRADAASRLAQRMAVAKDRVGGHLFDSFVDYELRQFDALVDNTLSFVRIVPVRSGSPDDAGDTQAVSGGLVSKNPDRLWRSDTITGCLANMTVTAPVWLFSATAPMQWRPDNADTSSGWLKMITYRALYLISLIIFAIFCFLVLALTGATLARMSALEFAGYERASLKHSFLFALNRLWVFIKAPIIPFLILLVIGIIIAIVGLIGAVPYLGEIALGILFILFLIGGFVLMLLLLGIIGGFNLLYPTIAVEGSDAFDAMSRSFAYVYARPWRLILYTVVSLIYGAITYLFVSFAVYLVLLLTHVFTGWGTNLLGSLHGHNSGLPKLTTLWPTPQFSRLIAPTNWYAMNWSEYTGSLFLHFWVYLLICTIGAYVISYYFSTHTIIYLLLRRSVDGQSTAEVFTDDEPMPIGPATPGTAADPGSAPMTVAETPPVT
jgi:hypothetical protein